MKKQKKNKKGKSTLRKCMKKLCVLTLNISAIQEQKRADSSKD